MHLTQSSRIMYLAFMLLILPSGRSFLHAVFDSPENRALEGINNRIYPLAPVPQTKLLAKARFQVSDSEFTYLALCY